jgi:hypothetical protein
LQCRGLNHGSLSIARHPVANFKVAFSDVGLNMYCDAGAFAERVIMSQSASTSRPHQVSGLVVVACPPPLAQSHDEAKTETGIS